MNKNERNERNTRNVRGVKKKSFLKENGIIIGLYSVVGVLVVSAGVLTVQNFNMAENLLSDTELVLDSKNNMNRPDVPSKDVSKDNGVSYKDKENGEIGIAVSSNVGNTITKTSEKKTKIEEVVPKEKENDQSNNDIKQENQNNPSENEKLKDTSLNQEESEKKEDKLKEAEEEKNIDSSYKYSSKEKEEDKKDTDEFKKININKEDEKEKEEENLEDEARTTMKTVVEESIQTNNNALFTAFDEKDEMIWPVVGEILMPYSEEFIHDITLDQYLTNDTLRITSIVGSNVQASFDGEVVKVGNTYEDGYFVVLSHGNGWSSVYSQLDSKLLVSEGDIVTKGQTIGSVANPTRRYSSLDAHLGFRVEKDMNSINPELVFKD